ncbi:unnamed protein product [Caretta caretta]
MRGLRVRGPKHNRPQSWDCRERSTQRCLGDETGLPLADRTGLVYSRCSETFMKSRLSRDIAMEKGSKAFAQTKLRLPLHLARDAEAGKPEKSLRQCWLRGPILLGAEHA